MKSSIYLSTSWRAYAVLVNRKRAIPSIPDGLKEAQRIGLWVMRNRSGKSKTVGVAGAMAESLLYVHGDQSAQDSLSALAAPYMNNLPLLNGHGNFGTLLKPNKWSNARYTEISKPSYLEELLFTDIDIVPMEDNYDGSRKMPSHFLPLIPLTLLNGQKGVGVGFASNIFPRPLQNIVEATLLCLQNKPIPPDLLKPVYVSNQNNTGAFLEYTKDGKPRWEFRGSLSIVNTTTVVVTQLPSVDNYILEDYREFLDGLIEKDIISDYDDHSTKKIKVMIKFSRGALKDKTEEDLMKMLGLIKTNVENPVVVGADGFSLPTYYHQPNHKYPDPIERMIREWVEWRFAFFEKRYARLIQLTNAEINYLMVLKACFDERLPDVFMRVANRAGLKNEIQKIADKYALLCNDDISDRISGKASYSWTTESYQTVLENIKEQNDLLAEYEDLAGSETKRRTVFKAEVSELKKIKEVVIK